MGERYSYQSRIQEFPGTNVNTFGIHFQDVGFKLKILGVDLWESAIVTRVESRNFPALM